MLAEPHAATFTATAHACAHCGTSVLAKATPAFCCDGCRVVYSLLRDQKLTRYYALGGGAGAPVAAIRTRDHKWLEPIEARLKENGAGLSSVALDVQGLHCSACVWLIDELFRRGEGAGSILVNPALGSVAITASSTFDLRHFVNEVEEFGYAFGPPLKLAQEGSTENALLLRMGICIALTMNAMVFALAIYLGLRSGPTYELMHAAGYGLSCVAVVVGGSVFFASAWRALRRGVLHMDAPIALGIALAFLGSTWSFFWGDKRASYFDTITTFTTLMLVGRWLQERVLARNRRRLLADDGVDGLFARRIVDSQVQLVRCSELRANDELLLASGDLVPVDAELLDADASISLDWISGESAPRTYARGATLPAGAFNAGDAAIRARACTTIDASPLVALLRSPTTRTVDAARTSPWWQRLARYYVAGVFAVSIIGGIAWYFVTRDGARTLDVVTAILVVTCPCALGIATPLAYEFVQAGLRRIGLFVRTATFLDRAREVTQVVLDKTGTLTSGALAIADTRPLDQMTDDERNVLYNLVVRSTHPKSLAVTTALRHHEVRFTPIDEFVEVPGAGLACRWQGQEVRFGAAAWAAGETHSSDLVFSFDGVARSRFQTCEDLRPDAKQEVESLFRDGYDVWIVSGDTAPRVQEMARILRVRADHALAECTPTAKAEWLSKHDLRNTLMVGDGINDSLAVSQAWCAGTPAVDRPFMPARSDFYFTSAGLAPIRTALRAARALHRVTRRNLAFAIAYNVFAVALCLSGVMRPWLAAVLMPASSLFVIASTVASLSSRSRLWK